MHILFPMVFMLVPFYYYHVVRMMMLQVAIVNIISITGSLRR